MDSGNRRLASPLTTVVLQTCFHRVMTNATLIAVDAKNLKRLVSFLLPMAAMPATVGQLRLRPAAEITILKVDFLNSAQQLFTEGLLPGARRTPRPPITKWRGSADAANAQFAIVAMVTVISGAGSTNR
jgi:hypothetical protein